MLNVTRFASIILLGCLLTACNLPTAVQTPTATSGGDTVTPEDLPVGSESESVPESYPVVEQIADASKLVERTRIEAGDDPRYEFQAVWPNLAEDVQGAETFNAEVDWLVQTALEEFLTAVQERQAETGGGTTLPPSTLSIDYDLTVAAHDFYCVHLMMTTYIAISAHPYTVSHALNFDAERGDFLSLKDLFLMEVDYQTRLVMEADAVLLGRGVDYQTGLAGEVMETRENWNLLPEGLRLNFDMYEVAPYAAGPQYVLIPWADLAGILDSGGPGGQLLE